VIKKKEGWSLGGKEGDRGYSRLKGPGLRLNNNQTRKRRKKLKMQDNSAGAQAASIKI